MRPYLGAAEISGLHWGVAFDSETAGNRFKGYTFCLLQPGITHCEAGLFNNFIDFRRLYGFDPQAPFTGFVYHHLLTEDKREKL